jgi:hypothetical protein
LIYQQALVVADSEVILDVAFLLALNFLAICWENEIAATFVDFCGLLQLLTLLVVFSL